MTRERHVQTLRVLLIAVVNAILVDARAQDCQPYWSDEFPSSGVDGTSRAVAAFDDGAGPAIYVGGEFVTAGGLTVNNIARWDGTALSAVGSGFNGSVRALIAYDDGSGPALYAGGEFTEADGQPVGYVARWDGTSWEAVGSGMNGAMYSFVAFDDGAGIALYAGGHFSSADNQPAGSVARWNGSDWVPVGTGVTNGPQSGDVRAIASGMTPAGPVLFAGGNFDHADAIEVDGLAGWDGEEWFSLDVEFTDSYLSGLVHALAYYDDGNGPALFVGGNFNAVNGIPASNIARWDGKQWAEVGGGIAGISVYALNVFELSGQAELYASGNFSSAGGSPADGTARWDGESWTAMSNGTWGSWDLAVVDDGSGPALYGAGGYLNELDQYTSLIRWDGAIWSGIYSGKYNGVSGGIFAMTTFDDGQGPALYVGGYLESAGSMPANHIARWDGQEWSALGEGVNDVVRAMVVYDDGSGPALYVGGNFTTAGGQPANYIAKWDGSRWHPVGAGAINGLNNQVMVLHVHSDVNGTLLYAGGWFTMAGGQQANRIIGWNGTHWVPLAYGVSGLLGTVVYTLASAPPGFPGAPCLVVGGNFDTATGVTVNGIAQWDGLAWSALADGMGEYGVSSSVAFFDDGVNGPSLYSAGSFTYQVHNPSFNLGRWTGSEWVEMDSDLIGAIDLLTVYDDGSGSGLSLFGSGSDTDDSGDIIGRVVRWNGSEWSAFGSDLNNPADAMQPFNDGKETALYVAGSFTVAGSLSSRHIAKWGGCETNPPPGDLTFDWHVGFDDLSLLLSLWGSCPDEGACLGDVNGDGVVGALDLALLLANWG